MSRMLRHYQVVIRTIGPVFIGNGKDIGKKEYVFLSNQQVGIPDIQKLYSELKRRGKGEAFEEFLLYNRSGDLTDWLKRNDISGKDINRLIRYTLDCGDAIIENKRKLQIKEFIKDAYGNPYIPGSSIKGMLRTILLGNNIIQNPMEYQSLKNKLQNDKDYKKKRNVYLRDNIAQIEEKAFNTLNKSKKSRDAVNDSLQGLIVSDSKTLSQDTLVLCQKVERHTDGTEKNLPILREAVKPDTKIEFEMTIDPDACNITGKMLMEAVQTFGGNYYDKFSSVFKGMDVPKANCVYLGGGSGFASKTIIYSMFDRSEGIDICRTVFDNTNVPRSHKHEKDRTYGVSPHIIKCTRYGGQTFQMGLCKIEKITMT